MRVILLNLPWQRGLRLGVRAGSRWPFTSLPEQDGTIRYIPFPFFLAYAASLLKREGQEAVLIDAIAEGINEQAVIARIKKYSPGLLVVETSTPSFTNDLNIIQNIKQAFPEVNIAISGPHASVFAEDILNRRTCINYVLIGEYEYTLLDLLNCLEARGDLAAIPGLAYRRGQESIVNQHRPTINNLNTLPWPERETLDLYKYNDGFAGLPTPNVQIWSSRGCPFQCSFCLWPQAIYCERKYRKRNPQDVAAEIKHLIDTFHFRAIYFDDDIFNADREHVLNICNEIKKRNIEIPWAAMARADLMDQQLLEAMASAGLYALKYGIESAEPAILRNCDKDMNLDKASQMVRLTKEIGIKVHLSFCLGLPGESKSSLAKTAEYIRQLQPDSLQCSLATPFPGTKYFTLLKEDGRLTSADWADYDGNHSYIVKNQELSKEDLERAKIAFCSGSNL